MEIRDEIKTKTFCYLIQIFSKIQLKHIMQIRFCMVDTGFAKLMTSMQSFVISKNNPKYD